MIYIMVANAFYLLYKRCYSKLVEREMNKSLQITPQEVTFMNTTKLLKLMRMGDTEVIIWLTYKYIYLLIHTNR